MKKKFTFFGLAMLLCIITTFAQVPYYGAPFYKEGFDNASLPSGWVQSGKLYSATDTTLTTTAWSTVANGDYSPAGKRFSNADPTSTYTLLCSIAANKGLIDTLTSSVITNTETGLICVGFSVFDPATAFPLGYGYMAFEGSKDGGVTWDELWRSNGTTAFDYTEINIPISFAGWKTIRVNLPATYNGQNFQVRFRVNSPDLRGAVTMNLYIDGLFASKRRANDAQPITVNNFSATAANNNRAYLQTPVTVKFINQGTNPISSIDLGYRVSTIGQSDQIVNETYSLSTPLQPRDTGTYIFQTKADLSLRRATYTVKAWTALTGEEYVADDTLSFTLQNTMTDVPYIVNWGTTTLTLSDEWTTVPTYTSTLPGWTRSTYGRIIASVCDGSRPNIVADDNSYYFSRAVYLKAGKTYELKFNTLTQSNVATDVNAMQVYWTANIDTNASARIGNLLFNKTDINNAALRQTVYVTPAKDSAYYFVFKAIGKMGNKPLYLYDVTVREVSNIDAQIISLSSPMDKTYRYANNETITVKVGNAGLQTIAAGAMKVYYQFEDNVPIEETITESLALGATVNHTFTPRVDMTALKTYNLKVGVSLVGDTSASNDILSLKLNPMVTELPYNGSLGSNTNNRTYEEDYWTSVDDKWAVSATNAEVRWSYNGTAQTPKTTTDTLYSRPIHIDAGTSCRFNYSVARSNANATVFAIFKVGVYQKNGNTYDLIALANDTVIKTAANAYTTYVHDFIPATSGDYYFGYITGPQTTGLTYSVYMKEPMFTLVGDVGVSEIISPTFINNCSTTTPITVKIQNHGTNNIYSIPVAYSINNEVAITETIVFSPALEANQAYNYTFGQTADMSGTDDYTITAYTNMNGDMDQANDTASIDIIYAPYMQYGDVNNAVVFSNAGAGAVSGTNIGLLNDGSAFVSYWRATPADSTALVPFKFRYNMFTQLLDQRGVPQWEEDFQITSNDITFSLINSSTVDKQGNFVFGFTNGAATSDGTSGVVRVSKVNANKEYLFGRMGVIISPLSVSPLLVCKTIKTDSKGDIYVAVGTNNTEYANGKLYKVNGQTGDIISSINRNVSSMEFDEKDNLYVVYQESAGELKLQVYNTDLISTLSTSAIVTTTGADNGNLAATSIMKFDQSGGLWVCYYSQSRYNNTIFVQYLNNNMVPQITPNGVPVSNNTSRHRLGGWPVVMDDEDVLAFAFSETVAGGTVYYYIKGQKITKDGTLLMGAAGTDIIEPMLQNTMSAVGLDYHNSKLVLNYNYWKGSGNALLENSGIAFYDENFENSTKIDYSLSNYDPRTYKTASDNYGIYTVWISETSGNNTPIIAKAQHVYFDETMTNKALSVKVKSNDPYMGYAVGGGLLNAGDIAVMKAAPVPGNEFVEWRIGNNMVSTANPYEFEVSQNVTLTAVFRKIPTFIVTATAIGGGTITPSGEVEVAKGSDKIFTFTPNEGYALTTVLIDGVENPTAVENGYYTFTNVTQAHTIIASFVNLDVKTVDADKEIAFIINPNPVKVGAKFYIKSNLKQEELNKVTVRLYDLSGRMQMVTPINGEGLAFTSPSVPGIYIVQITSSKGIKKEMKLVVVQ